MFDPGIFAVGDTLCTSMKKNFSSRIPTFAEHFARVLQVDTIRKHKQFIKGVDVDRSGGRYIQIFQELLGSQRESLWAWWACCSSRCPDLPSEK